MDRLLLTNGLLIDGSGAPPYAGHLLIEDGRIAEIGPFEPPSCLPTLDCTGLAISPGFIDAHSHSDLQVLENRPEKLLQGVTTEVVGNCGFSAYPAPSDRRPLYEFANGLLCGDDRWGWPDASSYLKAVTGRTKLAHVVSLLGHGTLRVAHAGHQLGPLPARTLDAMEQCLAQALSDGARGFSTGLMYAPGSSAPSEELERLYRVVSRSGAVCTTHMRDYGFKLVEAVDEQIGLARRTGCRLQISHLQAVGPANWERQAPALEKIERARREGVDIAFDCYPYVAGSTVLTQWLPQWALEGGISGLMARLSHTLERSRIAEETIAGMAHRWTDLVISSVGSEANAAFVGKTVQEAADSRGREPIEFAFDLLTEEQGVVNILEFNQSEDNLRQTVTHPLSNLISDGFYVKGRPHPRLHGAFAELLGKYCREKRWLSLEDAVHKITGLPASRFHIAGRGLLRPGFHADVAVFDPARIASPANYQEPQLPPIGIHCVILAGSIVHGGPILNGPV